MKTLVTGGSRSGKSALAETLLARHAGDATAVYIATGPLQDDADWMHRLARHQAQRPAHWRTIETAATTTCLPELLVRATHPTLLDCLGNWLSRELDQRQAWERPLEHWQARMESCREQLVEAIAQCPAPLILVSNEVGWSTISEHRAARLFSDELGRLNQQVAAVCEQVVLCVAGQALTIKGGGREHFTATPLQAE